MPTDCITYQESGYFSSLMVDYLNQNPALESLYNRFPTLENFKAQIEEKQADFRLQNRILLSEALKEQYSGVAITELTRRNLDALQHTTTFTVTTGHQLNLFTGPLYFLYKIISAVNLAKELKTVYPEYDFVPVYWMATEDHDFDEIHYFNYNHIKFQWNKEASGPVGRLKTHDLNRVYDAFASQLGTGIHARQLKEWFEEAYLQHDNLAAATRYLANALFGSKGLIIIDGDDKKLKSLFAPYAQRELHEQLAQQKVSETFSILKTYSIQVNPRKINLFFMEDGLRERIVYENGRFKVLNTSLEFSAAEIHELAEKHPEKFSPNVVLRPLYQEIILPNLAYIGGGGELAYWLELLPVFKAFKVPFPMLLLRNSAVLVSEKQNRKADTLGLSWRDLFLKPDHLLKIKTNELSENTFNFDEQRQFLQQQFQQLREIALKTDPSFTGAVEAQEKKQLKGLQQLEKRLLLAEKRVHKDVLERMVVLQSELFPKGSLQERQLNFSSFYKEYGNTLFEKLTASLQPLEQNFRIVTL